MSRVRRQRDFAARRRGYVIWGAAVLTLFTGASVLAFAGTGVLPFTGGGFQVRALVTDAAELRPDAPVRIAGVEVGRVAKVGRGPGGTALVTLRLRDAGRPVHADATLKIRPRLFLEGNFFVDLRPGSPSARRLRHGDTIPLAQTATPVQLDQVLGALQADGREQLQVVVRELGAALGEGGGRALGRALDPAGGALENGAVTASALRGLEERDLSGTVAALARVTAALDERRAELGGVVRGFDRTAGALAAEDRALSATVRLLAATLREARPAVRDLRAAMPATLAFSRDVRPLLRRAPATLDLARPLLRELRGLLSRGELPALTRALRPPVRTLAATQPELEALLTRVTPVTDCVRERALPVLDTPVEDGAFSTGQPPWLELLHGVVGLASASQNFDGNGTAVRYLAGFGEQLFSTGRLPTPGRLQGLTQAPLEGARPAPPQGKPPFRPDVPCMTQGLVDLSAPAAGAPPPEGAPPVSRRDRALLREALAEVAREGREARR